MRHFLETGGKCGSTTIDRAFHRLMRSRFGMAFTSLPLAKKGAGSNLMKQFESAKRDFGSAEYAKTYRFHLKMNAEDSRYFDADDDEVLITTWVSPVSRFQGEHTLTVSFSTARI
jgi:hypothetical protein